MSSVVTVKTGEDGLLIGEVDLSCPVCYEVIEGAHESVCGHLCCKSCIKRIDKCPICQNPSPLWTLNRYIDRIAQNIPRSCRYAYRGCEHAGGKVDMIEHAKTCEYKPTKIVTRMKKHTKPRAISKIR